MSDSAAEVPMNGEEEINGDSAESDQAKTFKDLGLVPELCDACHRRGWLAPSPIQIEAIPIALKGRDVIGLAKTGSGKTAAYTLPMLQALLERKREMFGAVLTPTRELAFQVKDHIEALGAKLAIKVTVLTGGMDFKSEVQKLKNKPHIIVATPGRLLDHLKKTKGFTLEKLEYLVFDEADRMFGLDLEQHMNTIISVIPKKRTTMLFSATMNKSTKDIKRISLNNPAMVKLSNINTTVRTLEQYMKLVPYVKKMTSLAWVLKNIGASDAKEESSSGEVIVTPSSKSVIIFCITRKIVLTVYLTLKALNFRAVPLYGKMEQNKRLGALHKFKNGSKNILIATDVASRGLDIQGVDWVINHDIPASTKDYIHRVGRTARAGKSGASLTLLNQYDVFEFMELEKKLQFEMKEFDISKEEVDILHPAVKMAEEMSIKEVESMDTDRQVAAQKKGRKRRAEKKHVGDYRTKKKKVQ